MTHKKLSKIGRYYKEMHTNPCFYDCVSLLSIPHLNISFPTSLHLSHKHTHTHTHTHTLSLSSSSTSTTTSSSSFITLSLVPSFSTFSHISIITHSPELFSMTTLAAFELLNSINAKSFPSGRRTKSRYLEKVERIG